jgi:hypothetical protein
MKLRSAEYSEGDSYTIIHNLKEDDPFERSFYLRTGKTIEDLTKEAKKEFGKNSNLNFNTGKFLVNKEKVVLTPEYSPSLTHLIAEGLFYQKENKPIETIRNPTRDLLETITGFIDDIRQSKEDLTKLLTHPQNPAIIQIPGINPFDDFLREVEYSKLAKGFIEYRTSIMNYGYIFGKRSTFILDGKEGDNQSQWYILPNSDLSIEQIKMRFAKNAKVGTISKSEKFSFSEMDKVNTGSSFFFDGTTRDLIEELTKNEIKLEKGLLLSQFSNK